MFFLLPADIPALPEKQGQPKTPRQKKNTLAKNPDKRQPDNEISVRFFCPAQGNLFLLLQNDPVRLFDYNTKNGNRDPTKGGLRQLQNFYKNLLKYLCYVIDR